MRFKAIHVSLHPDYMGERAVRLRIAVAADGYDVASIEKLLEVDDLEGMFDTYLDQARREIKAFLRQEREKNESPFRDLSLAAEKFLDGKK